MSNFGTNSLDTEAFERHSTALLRQIISGKQSVAPITSKETQLMAHKHTIKKINEELETSLTKLMDDMATFVYPSDLVLFLIAAKNSDLMSEAQEIVDSVMQDRRLMSLNDLLAALASSSSMPGSWAASLFGSMDAERDATPKLEVKKASIDLAAMHRGMNF